MVTPPPVDPPPDPTPPVDPGGHPGLIQRQKWINNQVLTTVPIIDFPADPTAPDFASRQATAIAAAQAWQTPRSTEVVLSNSYTNPATITNLGTSEAGVTVGATRRVEVDAGVFNVVNSIVRATISANKASTINYTDSVIATMTPGTSQVIQRCHIGHWINRDGTDKPPPADGVNCSTPNPRPRPAVHTRGLIRNNRIVQDAPRAGDQHQDGIQFWSDGQYDIIGNYIRGWSNSCILIGNEYGRTDDVRIENNWFHQRPIPISGGTVVIYAGLQNVAAEPDGYRRPTNVKIRNNVYEGTWVHATSTASYGSGPYARQETKHVTDDVFEWAKTQRTGVTDDVAKQRGVYRSDEWIVFTGNVRPDGSPVAPRQGWWIPKGYRGEPVGKFVPTEPTPAEQGNRFLLNGAYLYGAAGNLGEKALPAYESWLGRPVDLVHDFTPNGGGDSWDQMLYPEYLMGPWRDTGKRLMITVGMLAGPYDRSGPTKGSFAGQPVSHALGASGKYDALWTGFAQLLVSQGHPRAIVRIGHEHNAGFYIHRAQGEAAAYKAYWRRIVTTVRAVPGQQFVFVWCPNWGYNQMGPDVFDTYPGDEYCDWVGLDVYDEVYGPNGGVIANDKNGEARWNATMNNADAGGMGLQAYLNFCRAGATRSGVVTTEQMPMFFPEWGLTKRGDNPEHGGEDNPVFIQKMHDLWTDPANAIVGGCYFEVDAGDGLHALSPATNGLGSAEHPGVPTRYPVSSALYRSLNWSANVATSEGDIVAGLVLAEAGDWSPTTAYTAGSVVSENGARWAARIDVPAGGFPPHTNTSWILLGTVPDSV